MNSEQFLQILKEKGYNYVIKNNVIIVNYKGNVYLNSLTTLPENFKFENKGGVYLDSLTTLPENVKFENVGDVSLFSLTTLPENFKFENVGDVSLFSLTTLSENVKFENEGFIYLRSLTTLSENVKFQNKCGVYLPSLTTLPNNMFRNPITQRIVKRNLDGTFYAGCFKGNLEQLIKVCKEKNFTEVKEWAINLK